VNLIPRNGSPIAIIAAAAPRAIGAGRRMTARDSRYHGPDAVGLRSASVARRAQAGESALTRGPSIASMAGSTTNATAQAMSATSIPPSPVE
jgi:hypothetical protein